MKIKAILLFAIISLFAQNARAEKCFEELLLDGAEPLLAYGLDSTSHWWAVTQPFEGRYRLVVDGEETADYEDITNLTFSPDGERWACFGLRNNFWHLITEKETARLPGTKAGEIAYSQNSRVLAYSYYVGSEETIVYGDKKIKIVNRAGNLLLDWSGYRLAFMGWLGNGYQLDAAGWRSDRFDEIIPIGFWRDGKFLYAGKLGDSWVIYKNDEDLTEPYFDVSETTINLFGTAAAAICMRRSGKKVAVLISDEYYDPIESKPYDGAQNLVLHPTLDLFAFSAYFDMSNIIVYSSAEYFAGETEAVPHFTHDGEELYFMGCDFDCFVSLNGREYPVLNESEKRDNIAVKPGSLTYAFSTNSALCVFDLELEYLACGFMVDEIGSPRFNRRADRYEALGVINNKLYMLYCYP